MHWLESIRESLGELDTYKLDTVLGLRIKYDYDYRANKLVGAMELKVTYATDREVNRVLVIRAHAFRRIRLPEISGDLFQFNELEVQDVSESQLDGVNYQIKDYQSEFECDCDDVSIERVYEYACNGTGKLLWSNDIRHSNA